MSSMSWSKLPKRFKEGKDYIQFWGKSRCQTTVGEEIENGDGVTAVEENIRS